MRNALFIVVALVAAAGCGSADEHPLGGPYGGSSNGAPAPTKGTSAGSGDQSTGDDGTGTPGTGTPGTGTPGTGTPGTGTPGTTPPGGTTDPPDAGAPVQDAGTTPPPVSGTDSGTTPPPPPPPPPPPAAPTWTAIVNAYLKSGTVGNCGASGCHSQMNSPSSAYTWLGNKGYPGKTIADPQQSPMSWYGGNMPPNGPSSNAKATADMNAWAAAGAKNN